MTVTIELKPEIEEALQKKAEASGSEINVYLVKLIEKDVYQAQTIDEILAPFRREIEESKISDEQFDEFVEEIRDEVYREKINRAE